MRFIIETGWFNGEPWTLFSITLFEFIGLRMFSLVRFRIFKFVFDVIIDYSHWSYLT